MRFRIRSILLSKCAAEKCHWFSPQSARTKTPICAAINVSERTDSRIQMKGFISECSLHELPRKQCGAAAACRSWDSRLHVLKRDQNSICAHKHIWGRGVQIITDAYMQKWPGEIQIIVWMWMWNINANRTGFLQRKMKMKSPYGIA